MLLHVKVLILVDYCQFFYTYISFLDVGFGLYMLLCLSIACLCTVACEKVWSWLVIACFKTHFSFLELGFGSICILACQNYVNVLLPVLRFDLGGLSSVLGPVFFYISIPNWIRAPSSIELGLLSQYWVSICGQNCRP